MTHAYGIVVFTGTDGEWVDPELLGTHYAHLSRGGDYVWGSWRPATLEELVRTWPAKPGEEPASDAVWWQPSIDALRVARKAAQRQAAKRS